MKGLGISQGHRIYKLDVNVVAHSGIRWIKMDKLPNKKSDSTNPRQLRVSPGLLSGWILMDLESEFMTSSFYSCSEPAEMLHHWLKIPE